MQIKLIFVYEGLCTWPHFEKEARDKTDMAYSIQFNLMSLLYIIVVVLDTNKWFHQTDIVGKEMSITIGSEYD